MSHGRRREDRVALGGPGVTRPGVSVRQAHADCPPGNAAWSFAALELLRKAEAQERGGAVQGWLGLAVVCPLFSSLGVFIEVRYWVSTFTISELLFLTIMNGEFYLISYL